MEKLPLEFYSRNNVLQIARELLGKLLVTYLEGKTTSGRIVEVEAYNGVVDKASHAFGNRRTNRTETMYAEGGVAYVYLCYGIHHLFNVITNMKDSPHAILIRALEPVTGIATMLQRTGKKKLDFSLTRGPGNLSKALGISTLQNGFKLTDKSIYIADDGIAYAKKEIAASPRIGVDYAAEDALLPYRFYKKENLYVSGKPK
ncbi:MAG: DNA-3-methyladenine glycosylase [Chitinophagaceae bacterium]